MLVEDLGPDWTDLLTIDRKPAGAASIGQVHRGVWLDTGLPVAIKIQYPGVAKALRSDLRQLGRVAKLLGVLGSLADATGLVEELSERLTEELDYRREADNQRAYAAAFAGDPLVVVPPVLHATEKVLVTGWLDGEPLSARIHDSELDQDRRDRIGACLVHAIYAGPEKAGMLHADPHPGNFMLLPDGRLGLLDFGAVKRLPGGIPAPLGLVGLLCQLEATVALRDMELRWSPGFRSTVADQTGVDADALLAEATARLDARYSLPAVPAQRRNRRPVAASA